MGRLKQATRDLDDVLALKPDFDNVSRRGAPAALFLGSGWLAACFLAPC